MRVVVVGATGNLGTALLTRLQAEPEVTSLVGVARRGPRMATPPYGEVTWFSIDVGADDSPVALEHAFAGADAIVHLGWALQPSHRKAVMYRTNVLGTSHVLDAAARAGVPHVLVASSVGAYSRGPKGRRVDETYKTKGVRRSSYSKHKSINERVMDAFAEQHPEVTLTRMRPGLVFQAAAASEIVGLFAGRWVPTRWMQRVRPPFIPLAPRFVSQVVHASDVADAFRAFGSRLLPVPYRLLRAVVQLTWLARLQPTEPGWLDIAAKIPVMSTEKARTVLDWTPRHTSDETLREFAHALAHRTNHEGSHPLHG